MSSIKQSDTATKKRQHAADLSNPPNTHKKVKPAQTEPPQSHSLIGPHEDIVAELSSKYNVLTASVISSTQIRKRINQIMSHILEESAQPRLVLLHARTSEVCKMITVVEQCKRIFGKQGKSWYQYNQLFDLPADPKNADRIEETVLEKDLDDSDSDDFEVMESRFEKAIRPQPQARIIKSLRIFLSLGPVAELRAKPNVTIQSREETN